MGEALAKLASVHVAALADSEADAALARGKMAPLCQSLCIEVRMASRPIALAQAVMRGEPVSLRLFRSAALAEQLVALLALGVVSQLVCFLCQFGELLTPRRSRVGN